MNKKRGLVAILLIFSLVMLYQPTPLPEQPATPTPAITSQKTYSPSKMNYTWSDAWNGPENNPLPDYESIPYRNVIKNPSGQFGTLWSSVGVVTDWVGSGTALYQVGISVDNFGWYGGVCMKLGPNPAAGANSAFLTQCVVLTGSSTTTLAFAIRQSGAVTTLLEWSDVRINYWDTSGTARTIYYVVKSASAAANEILIGTAIDTWYYAIRNVTADSLYCGYSPVDWIWRIQLECYETNANPVAYFDSLYLGNDPVMYQGSNPWYNNEFEHPVNSGVDATNNFYPYGWTGPTGANAGTCGFNPYNNFGERPYLHFSCVKLGTNAVGGAYKGFYYTIGTNPLSYVSFSLIRYAGAAGQTQEIILWDTTSTQKLYYEFSLDAGAVRAEDARHQVIHLTTTISTWYYRIKDWKTDWAAAGQFGVAPTMADTWRIAINCTTNGAVQIWCGFDAIWMGNTLPPKYNAFMFGDFRNVAWMSNFNGEYTGWVDEYGYDYDGLFVADDIAAAATRYAQITFAHTGQTYDTREITVGMGWSKVLTWTDGGGTEQIGLSPQNITSTAWAVTSYVDPRNDDIWNTGILYHPVNSKITFEIQNSLNTWGRILINGTIGAGGAVNARIVLRWMSIEISASDTDMSISYYDLDGWGVDYWFVQTYVNGTRQPNAQFTLANAVGSVLNITVTDYFGNIVYQNTAYPVTSTTTIIDVQLELVSTTLQSYGLTRCDIYGNVTFSELFEEPLDPAVWDSVVVGDLTVANGRLNETTEVPGDIVFLYTLDTYPTASTVTVYATTDNILDNYGISVMGYDAPFPGGTEWWVLMTNPGVGEWTLMARQVGLIGARDVGGIVAANTWYKIVITMVDNYIWATVYNPDETINVQLETWYDDQPATWSYALENAADGPTFTFYDLFVVQGNLGYTKTLTFYDAGNTLLMPDDYVFNGTAWNEAIRFQSAATITVTLNRVIELVDTVEQCQFVFYRQDGSPYPRDAFNVTINNNIYGADYYMGFHQEAFLGVLGGTTHVHVRDIFNVILYDGDVTNDLDIRVPVPCWHVKFYTNSSQAAITHINFTNTFRYYSGWVYTEPLDFWVNPGTYNIIVTYPRYGLVVTYTGLVVATDIALVFSSNATWDIYSTLTSYSSMVNNIVAQVANHFLLIHNQLDDQVQWMESLQELNEMIYGSTTDTLTKMGEWDWAIMIIVIFSVGACLMGYLAWKRNHPNYAREIYGSRLYADEELKRTREERMTKAKRRYH